MGRVRLSLHYFLSDPGTAYFVPTVKNMYTSEILYLAEKKIIKDKIIFIVGQIATYDNESGPTHLVLLDTKPKRN